MRKLLHLILLVVFAASCSNGPADIHLIEPHQFETVIDGKEVKLFTLKNQNGLVTQITNLGGRVVSLWVPDRDGNFKDIVLGFDHTQSYLTANEKYYGALIGRYCNRIARGHFSLQGQEFQLACNNGPNHLHGGIKGFNNVVWNANQPAENKLELSYLSKDREEGYPGNLHIDVVYELTEKNELKIEYKAITDQTTVVNLTHHSFFNLQGEGENSINDHILQINADYYTPVDSDLIPTGEIASVEGTPMDFRKPTTIGKRLNADFDQLIKGRGYDHNWVLQKNSNGVTFAAKVFEPISGRILEVFTNEPGMQFYGGNFLTGTDIGKSNKAYGYRSAFCLETQHFPDSPNQPNFPSTVLQPGEVYYSICIYKFSTLSRKQGNDL